MKCHLVGIPIQTKLIAEQKSINEMWEHVKQEVQHGRQIYVVCPFIGDDLIEEGSLDEDIFEDELIVEVEEESKRGNK